jgi:hypothetical protein
MISEIPFHSPLPGGLPTYAKNAIIISVWSQETCRASGSESNSMSTVSHPFQSFDPASDFQLVHQAPAIPVGVFEEASKLGLGAQFPVVVELTRELFGDNFEITIEQDAEVSGWSDIVFSVQSAGSTEEILSLNTQWARRLPSTTEARGAFCLSIDEKP